MTLEILLLLIVAGAGSAAFSLAYATPAWLVLLPSAALFWWRIESAPRWLVRLLQSLSNLTCFAAVLLIQVFVFLPITQDFGPKRSMFVIGDWILLLITIFLLGSKVWPPARGVIPLSLALLVISFYKLHVSMIVPLAVAGAGLFGYLAFTAEGFLSSKLTRLAIYAGLTVLLTFGCVRGLFFAQDVFDRSLIAYFSPPSLFSPGQFADSELGSLEELKLSSKVVLRVWTDRAQKLRGRVHPFFDGRTWHSNETVRGPDPPALGALPFPATPDGVIALAKSDPRVLSTTVVPRTPGSLVLAPSGTLAVQANVPGMRMDAYQVLTWADVVPERYIARHSLDAHMVRPGDDPLPFWADSGERMREVCLTMPQKVDPRVRELAQKIAAGADSQEHRVRRTLEYLRDGYTYSLRPGKFRTFDPLAEFLFEKKKGYCEYFATSAAMLLRLQGVPTRYVTGYSVQEGNRNGNHYVVREKDGHAWIEVYIAGKGWIEADPTPPGEYEAMVEGLNANWFDKVWEWIQMTASGVWQRIVNGDWRGLWNDYWPLLLPLPLAPILGFLAAWVLRRWQKRKGKRKTQAVKAWPVAPIQKLDPALEALLKSLDDKWSSLGHARPASRGPLEHAQSLPAQVPAPLRVASLEAVECFYRGCFAGRVPEAAEIQKARSALETNK